MNKMSSCGSDGGKEKMNEWIMNEEKQTGKILFENEERIKIIMKSGMADRSGKIGAA